MVNQESTPARVEMGRRSFLGATAAATAVVFGGSFFHTERAVGAERDSGGSAASTGGDWSSERIILGGLAAAWEFDSDPGGWRRGNSLSAFSIQDGMLHTTVTGTDPWMVNNNVELFGLTDRILRIRMAMTPGDPTPDKPRLRIYFDTDDSPGFNNTKTLWMPIKNDGEFHEYQLDLGKNRLWTSSTVRRFRLDAEIPPNGAEITIDHIRIERQKFSDEHWLVEPLAMSGTAVAWNFETDGDTEGWRPTKGLAPLTVAGGTMSTTVTGHDPGMINTGVDLVGMRDRILHMRVRLTKPTEPPPEPRLRVYFSTVESPGLDASKVVWIDVPADGEFHEVMVDLGAENALWRSGTIRRIRLDREPPVADGAEWEFDFIRIEQMGARLAVRPPSVSPGAVQPGDSVTLASAVVNIGAESSAAFPAAATMPEGVSPSESDVTTTVPALPPFDRIHELTWDAVVDGDAPGTATVTYETPEATHHGGVVVPVVPGLSEATAARMGMRPVRGVRAVETNGHVVLSNSSVQAVFKRSSAGFTQMVLSTWDDDAWRQVATSQPLSWLLVAASGGGAELVPVVPSEFQISDDTVTFSDAVTDSSGTQWSVELIFALTGGRTQQAVQVEYRVTPDRDAELLSFRGPSLTAGEGTFGAAKSAALLPGVEWLVDDERSSSTLDIHPRPLIGDGSDLRAVPHPFNVTVPLMAVAADGAVVSVLWDTTQAWDGERRHPRAMFASPNWLDGQDNHLMSLFLPAVGDQLPPVSTYPANPYQAQAGTTLTVTAHYTAAISNDVLTAVSDWHEIYGVPQPAERPFSFNDELDLVRHAYLDSYWREDAEDFYGVYGRNTNYNLLPGVSLLIAGYLADDPAVTEAATERVQRFVNRVLEERGPAGLSNADNVTVAGWLHNGAFYLGHLEDALPEWARLAQEFRSTQQDDGSWVFTLRKENDEMLGKLGTPIMGRSARNAAHLLRYARLVGDEEARAAGLKGVDFVNQHAVPRAAQEWEVPIHIPDVLAAAYGALACGEAYRVTGDQDYLDRGLYWGRAALPFLYQWEDPERPMLAYASKPVLGASRYENSWLFRPVQWNGLMYALFMQEFFDAMYDPQGVKPYQIDWDQVDFPYRRVIEGILISAMHQQRLEEPAKGGYPDNWYLIANYPNRDIDLGPVRIAYPLFMLGATGAGGRPVDAQTAMLDDGIRISTAADVRAADLTDQAVTAELGFFDGATSQLLITGLAVPASVTVDGRALGEVDSLDDADEGWKRLSDGTLLIKMRHQQISSLVVQR